VQFKCICAVLHTGLGKYIYRSTVLQVKCDVIILGRPKLTDAAPPTVYQVQADSRQSDEGDFIQARTQLPRRHEDYS